MKKSKKINPDGEVGPINSCQICGATKFTPVVNLGHQPPCDLLPDHVSIKNHTVHYPLNVVRCVDCGLVQLDFVAPPHIVFHKKYPYRTGITQMLVNNFKQLAQETVQKFGLKKGDLIVDIGSNDGTALAQFKALGMSVVGVEPTDVAFLAIKSGIPTVNEFFTKQVAANIVKKYGNASVVIATNVFAHINKLPSFLTGVKNLLIAGGVFISESQYLLDTIQKTQYDTMYHEHLRFYSLKPLRLMFKKYGFTLTDAKRIPAAGGSIRVFATKGIHKPNPQVAQLIKQEEKFGLYKQKTYEQFRQRVEESRFRLVKLLSDLKLKRKTIAGVGSPGRSSPILNFCHIDEVLIPYLAEQPTSLKLGLYSPGTHIPVVDEKRLFKEQPDYALLLSWHIADTLIPKLRARGLKSKFIIPLGKVRIVS